MQPYSTPWCASQPANIQDVSPLLIELQILTFLCELVCQARTKLRNSFCASVCVYIYALKLCLPLCCLLVEKRESYSKWKAAYWKYMKLKTMIHLLSVVHCRCSKCYSVPARKRVRKRTSALTLLSLPEEVLLCVLQCLSAEDLLSVRAVSEHTAPINTLTQSMSYVCYAIPDFFWFSISWCSWSDDPFVWGLIVLTSVTGSLPAAGHCWQPLQCMGQGQFQGHVAISQHLVAIWEVRSFVKLKKGKCVCFFFPPT